MFMCSYVHMFIYKISGPVWYGSGSWAKTPKPQTPKPRNPKPRNPETPNPKPRTPNP